MSSLRGALGGLLLGFVWVSAATAQGTLLPPGFFDEAPVTPGGQAAVEADVLAYDAVNDVISAAGGVVMQYQGYVIRAERLEYHQRTGALKAVGQVAIADTRGNVFLARDIDVTGGFKEAFLQSLTIQVEDGSRITASSARYSSELEIMLEDGTYSPCGECIDAKGRRIGWKVRAARMVYNREQAVFDMEQPVLELLGIPVAWLPWLRIPDPSQPRINGFRLPQFDFSDAMGATVTLPYFIAVGEDTDILLQPRLMSRQGVLFAAEAVHRFANGVVDAKVAGLYQLDRSAFAGTVGDRDWRGAFQVSGHFVPVPNWSAGWSYTGFTDAAFLPDYKLTTGKSSVNQVYVTHLSPDYYADVRLQQFNLLGNVTFASQGQQAVALPNLNASSVTDLVEGWGQVRTAIRLLGVRRALDHTTTVNGVPYVYGYAGDKVHASGEASWQTQVVAPGGVLVTPYLGLRGDAAFHDGGSPLLAGPVSMLSATPIAALDVRWPLVATDGLSSYLFEPVAQLVYRGSGDTAPGITNDDAISFAYDDTNIFSYDRFSGRDRQETGLRATLGGHFVANFEDGSWIDLAAGQSFLLAGVNSLGVSDAAGTGLATGLGTPMSFVMVSARAGIGSEFEAAGKVRINPALPMVDLATAALTYKNEDRWAAALAYTYMPANPTIGTIADQHEVRARAGVPIHDYWSLTGTGAWDIATNNWLEAGLGVGYDDGYLVLGASGLLTGPTHTSPNDTRITGTIRLKGPTGEFGVSR